MILLIRFLSSILAALPLPAALAVGRGVGWVFGTLVRYHRRDALDALRHAFPEKTNREIKDITKRMYANLGMNAVEILRLRHVDKEYLRTHIDWIGLENLKPMRDSGCGGMILTAHLGNWEMLSIVAPEAISIPCSVIVKKIKGKALPAYVDESRTQFGLKLIPSKNSYRNCLRTLKRNELLGFVIDQNMIRREGEFIDFFGRPACTTLGLAHLAARTGTPVIPFFPVRKPDGRHEGIFLPAIDPPSSSDKETLISATLEYSRIVEDMIRKYPDQWIWIHRRWNTKPEEDAERDTESAPA